MGVINKIREKTGLVIGLVAFSLILFLLGADFFSPSSGLFGSKKSEVMAEIDGQEVKISQYQDILDKMIYTYKVNTQKNPDESAMNSIKQQAWATLINDIAYKNQYSEVGVAVSNSELTDMVQGTNISQEVRNAFTDPQTNTFDKDRVVSTLKRIADAPVEQQVAWQEFEQSIMKNRERAKYINLLTSTNYVTTAEAEYEHTKTALTASVKYLFVPFSTINDSTITVSNAELKSYLSSHSAEYQKDASRDIKYVSFPVKASAEDIDALKAEMMAIKSGFETATNDSIFASVNSEKDNFYTPYTGDNLPPSLLTEELEVGITYGPYQVGNEHHLYKIVDINDEGEPTARASHILFKWDSEDDKANTKREARKILNKIKSGTDFAEMARLHGTDGTASKGGDLGYFGEGRMVPEFEEAVFKARREGLLSDVVETQFGYHIIKVTAKKSNKQFIVASVVQDIYPSDETRNKVYRQAELFAAKATTLDQMIEEAKAQNLVVKDAKKVVSTAQGIPGVQNSRRIVRWLYRDAELNGVSEVFDLEDQYVVSGMSGLQEEGLANLEAVRSEVERKVRNEKKGKIIIDKLSGLSGSLEEIKSSYGDGAQINEMTGLSLNSNSLNTVGFSPEAVGKVFALEAGEKTEVFTTDNGALIAELITKAEPSEATDLDTYKKQLKDRREGSISYAVNQVIEDFADIEDNRYIFF